MNYDIAVLQRRHLLAGIEIYQPNDPTHTLPACDDRNSCMDGRCPTCGSRLVHALGAFARSDGAGHGYSSGGFLLNSFSVPENCDDKLDMSAVRSALEEISFRLEDWSSWFVGWFGIFVDSWGGNGRKVGALAFVYPRDFSNDAIIKRVLLKRFGRSVRRLPFWQAFPNMLYFEELLYGYTYASTSRPEAEPVFDRFRLAELALNYGQHCIADRIVTHGISIKGSTVVASPGASWQQFRDKFSPRKRGNLTWNTARFQKNAPL
ncbi:hypothetical protein GFM14_36225 [Rhizobium leguminosarum bv. viciae]|uniref:hypothetical protein n=1 Tax=Rhizobium leguminosarum TaxID=384 RepID=UPI00144186AC|nr:hypothetical protein [Rhizobium leguminosarum]NKJ96892.1 hypothetical protein [Rhizobium leguminosarum bv. viciae]